MIKGADPDGAACHEPAHLDLQFSTAVRHVGLKGLNVITMIILGFFATILTAEMSKVMVFVQCEIVWNIISHATMTTGCNIGIFSDIQPILKLPCLQLVITNGVSG